MIYCPNCAEQISADEYFCKRCGQRLRPLPPPSSPLPPPGVSRYPTGEITDPHPQAVSERYRTRPGKDEPSQEANAIPVAGGRQENLLSQANKQPGAIIRIVGDGSSDYIIDKPITLIGRSSKNDIALSGDRLVSRRHATLCFERNQYLITDEDSANGTYVNGIQIVAHKPYVLRDGAELRIGASILRFEIRPPEPAKVEEMPTVLRVSEAQDMPSASQHARSLWDCSVFYPKLIGSGSWNALLIYTHLAGATHVVRQDAMRVLQEIEYSFGKTQEDGEQMLLPDMGVTVIPEGEGVFFNPRRITLQGIKDWQRAIFQFFIKPELGAKVRACTVSFYMGPLLIGIVEIPLEFARQEPEQWPRASENCTQMTVESFQKVYLAYSDADRTIALACQKATRVFGTAMPYLYEVETLRTRQVVGEELAEKIAEADVFQLFWSANAARSPYMKQEWENALRVSRKHGFVRPVYWEVPLAAPPDELSQLRFSYVPAYSLG